VEEIKFYHEQCVKGSARILNLNIRLDISLKCCTRVKANNTGLKYRDVRNAAKPVQLQRVKTSEKRACFLSNETIDGKN